jgi:hypothetical protein
MEEYLLIMVSEDATVDAVLLSEFPFLFTYGAGLRAERRK